MVVAAAGAVRHDDIVRHAAAQFGALPPASNSTVAEVGARYVGGVRSSFKPFEQSHVVLGFEGPAIGHADAFTAQVLAGLLGGGMSSRLFQEVREKRGLCYTIYATAWGLTDSGMFQIHAATGAKSVAELVDVVTGELAALGVDGPTAREVDRAKAQLKAGLLMSLESSSARVEQMGRQMLSYGRLLSAEELIAEVEAVDVDKVKGFAARLTGRAPAVAIVGAGRRSGTHATKAHAQLSRLAGPPAAAVRKAPKAGR